MTLPAIHLAEDPAAWCAGGGLGVGPRNAAGLARAALAALPPGTGCPPAVMLLVDAPVAPHAWRVAGGGVAVTPGRWVRRYAALPAGAPLGTWLHESAHLLLGWPDLPGSPCLMGEGARRGGGVDPAPPCAPLRLAAGWLRAVPADADLRVGDLAVDEVAELRWGGRRLLLSVTEAGFSGVTVVLHEAEAAAAPLGSIGAVACDTPLLAAIAPLLPRSGDRVSRR